MHALNQVLDDVLVRAADGTQVAVMGSVEWESELFRGVSKMNVRVLDTFYGRNRQVSNIYFVLFRIFSHCFALILYCLGLVCDDPPISILF